MAVSNCLIYAVRVLFTVPGTRLVAEKSRHGWWPHFRVILPDGQVLDFYPTTPKRKRLFPPVLFRGRVRLCGFASIKE